MVYISKRKKEFPKIVEKKTYTLDEAIAQIAKFPKTKFDESVELHFALNVDLKASDQGVRGTVALPHGTGKKVRVAVFCKGEAAQKAQAMGAEFVGSNELIDKVAGGFLDFDCVIATPDMMRDLSKLGKILGPRGLMPSPKAGTVTADVEKCIKEVRAGRVEFKSDKQGGIHVAVGKRSFAPNQITENANQVIQAIQHAKPAAVKDVFFRTVYMSTTMGPGLKLAIK